MTTTAWAHLPNAKHIDAVLADVQKRPEAWAPTHRSLTKAALRAITERVNKNPVPNIWTALSGVLANVARPQGVTDSDGKRWTAHQTAAEAAAQNSIIALVFWDSSADLLDCTPDVLRAMVDLAEPPVCHQAALLLPYAIVRFGA